MRTFVAGLAITGLFCSPAFSQEQEATAEAAGRAQIELPPITYGDDPDVAKNGYKFFFFHNPAITIEEAAVDFADCRQHLQEAEPLRLPGFVRWSEKETREAPQEVISPYGLVGAVLTSIIAPKAARGKRKNKMRLCMGRRGYVRYAMNEEAYDAINTGEEVDVIAMQAKLATDPAPSAEVVTK